MVRKLATLITVSLLVWPATAQYHDRLYVMGGGNPPTTLPLQASGVHLVDLRGSAPVVTTIFQPASLARFCMDVDNRRLLVGVTGPVSSVASGPFGGLYRVDPATRAWSTVFAPPWSLRRGHSFFSPEIDHNGDVVVAAHVIDPSPTKRGPKILKIDQGGGVSTLLSTQQIGWSASFGALARDVMTGHLLVHDRAQVPPFIHGLLEIDTETGAVGTWSTGGGFGFFGGTIPQNHWTGSIQGLAGVYVMEQHRGTSPASTLGIVSVNAGYSAGWFDLQTAPRRRWVYAATPNSALRETFICEINHRTFLVNPTSVLKVELASASLCFYGGRNTQSVRVAPNRWDIRLSAHGFANRAYAIALSYTRPRPTAVLPDGRTLNLTVDTLTQLTLGDRLRPVFVAGRGVLDGRGEATAHLDLSRFGTLGIPLWVGWVVIDPAAPLGIGFVPDTYVMRV